jgi:hypothetical protein
MPEASKTREAEEMEFNIGVEASNDVTVSSVAMKFSIEENASMLPSWLGEAPETGPPTGIDPKDTLKAGAEGPPI